jgi:hypothetical protein
MIDNPNCTMTSSYKMIHLLKSKSFHTQNTNINKNQSNIIQNKNTYWYDELLFLFFIESIIITTTTIYGLCLFTTYANKTSSSSLTFTTKLSMNAYHAHHDIEHEACHLF